VTAITACTISYTHSAGVAYFSAGALACTVTVKLLKRKIRQARPPQTTHRKQKQTYGYVTEARAMRALPQRRPSLGCLVRIPQLSLSMGRTFPLLVHGYRCIHRFRKFLCFVPSLRWLVLRGHSRWPVPESSWGTIQYRRWLWGAPTVSLSHVDGSRSGPMGSMTWDE
jgi:hypothetical protein